MKKFYKSYKSLIFIISLLFVLSIAISGISAIDRNVDSGLNNTDIQGIIDSASDGDTINFLGDNYEDISLNVSDKKLVFVGTNTTLKTSSSKLINLKNSTGTSFSGFNFKSDSTTTDYLIYINGTGKDLVFANNTFTGGKKQLSIFNAINCTIDNNSFIKSTSRAIEILRNTSKGSPIGLYGNNTISNNYFNDHYDVMEIRVENFSIFNNIIDGYGGQAPEGSMAATMGNGALGIYVRMEWASGKIYNNTIINGYIGIKHAGSGLFGITEVYNNTFKNLQVEGVAYNVDSPTLYVNNTFENIPVAISLGGQGNLINLGKNTYINVGKSIYLPGVGEDPSLSEAVLNITTTLTSISIDQNGIVTYIIKLSNLGDKIAKNIVVNGIKYNGLDVVSTTPSIGTYNSTTGQWSINNLTGKSDAVLVLVFKGTIVSDYNLLVNSQYSSGNNASVLNSNSNPLTLKVLKPVSPPINPPKPVKKADLKISKITKKGVYRYITIKNLGQANSKANSITIYVGKKKIKTVNIKAIKAGKYIKIKVKIAKKYQSKIKTFKLDINNKLAESNEKNNKATSK